MSNICSICKDAKRPLPEDMTAHYTCKPVAAKIDDANTSQEQAGKVACVNCAKAGDALLNNPHLAITFNTGITHQVVGMLCETCLGKAPTSKLILDKLAFGYHLNGFQPLIAITDPIRDADPRDVP
jgi:hypothetical protein